jgi:AcrR family transcriptional regulator
MNTSVSVATSSRQPVTQEAPKPAKAQRSDGIEARTKLLNAALKLFAEKGFAKTSTREIAQAAGANIAAISYYFGDKAGLYRAVFTEPLGCAADDIPLYDQSKFTLRESLDAFYVAFLRPMRQGDLVRQCMRLHHREMLEPTGLWQEEVENGIKPAHAALVGILCRHLNLPAPDGEVHRLAFALTGLAVFLFMGREVIDAIQPQFFEGPDAVDLAARRLTDFAHAMVADEQARRSAAATVKRVTRTPVKKK